MSRRSARALRQKVMLPLLAIGILSAVVIGVLAYFSIEAQLVRQSRLQRGLHFATPGLAMVTRAGPLAAALAGARTGGGLSASCICETSFT